MRRWYGGAHGGRWLQPLAAVFGAIVRVRRAAYRRGLLRSEDPGCPVIVVGNVSVGGTGKTPLVIELARLLGERGLRVGIVTRGYGGSARAPLRVSEALDPRITGDEAWLMHRRTRCPVAVGRDRVAAARLLVAEGVDVILSDDGLQHYALARAAEIAVIDAARALGNGLLLPAGPLREPAARLAEVHAVVVNGGRLAAWPEAIGMQLEPAAAIQLSGRRAPRELESFAGQRVHAVAGIGHPGRFFAMLRGYGLQPVEHPFPDHHAYAPADLEFGDGFDVLMTEKDAVKCVAFGDARLWYVPVHCRIAPQDEQRLLARLLDCIAPEDSAPEKSWTRA